ncbi:hypothetical protein V6N12_023941 [Hibiscus sabdariffa]|uniref:Uncharacterized protein n=1 Tax=Hibiscus sabdariffa TaxID=183260 RepID=A0ABR2FZB3_9ROSI
MKSEFVALEKSGEEAEWLRNFLEDILERPKLVPTMYIHCDDQTEFGRAHSFICNGANVHDVSNANVRTGRVLRGLADI